MAELGDHRRALSSSRVAVVGAGGIGGLVAARLAPRPDLQVQVCSRRPFDHLVVDEWGEITTVPITMVRSAEEATVADWVIVATKAHQTASAADLLARLCGPGTRVAVLQNGVEHVERTRPHVGAAPILPVIVRYGAWSPRPGHVVVTFASGLVVARSQLGGAFAALMAGSDLPVVEAEDFRLRLWTKLAHNMSNGLTTIAQVRTNAVGRREPLRRLLRHLILECVAVARAEGVYLDEALSDSIVDELGAHADSVTSSMYQDRARGAPLEHDALNGAVVRIGARHGVPTPYNHAILALLEAISAPCGPEPD